jgi:hypothetical protein
MPLPPCFAFEFCDQKWVPAGARECLFETMEACNTGILSYNRCVAERVLELATEHGIDTIVELGAGRAPITTHLTQLPDSSGLRLIPCDLSPNVAAYHALEAKHPEQVRPSSRN